MIAPTPPRKRSRTGRIVVLWILFGILIGVFVSISLPLLRPRPTGIASLDLVVFADATGPGIGYAVDFEAERAGYPVVVHVDADGFPSLLFPVGGVARLDAGNRVRLPDPTGTSTWWSEEDQTVTVLTVLAEQPPADVDRLVELVERAAARASSPERALDDVKSVLRRRLGEPVTRILRPAHDS